jgi:predicted membrane protein
MKMGPSLFWGLLLVVLGLSLIFRIVFNIDFPLFKVFIAFVLIFFGLKMLFGSFNAPKFETKESDVVFGEKTFSNPNTSKDYSVVFGKGVYDFRDIDLKGEKQFVKISTVFGASIVKLNKNIPVKIRVESAFAGAELPNGNSSVFGSTTYTSPDFDPAVPYLDIKLEVVFGGCEVRTY